MIVLPIAAKPEVESILVVEQSRDVIKLVEPPIRKALGEMSSKLEVVEADIFEWDPPKGMVWNTIYFDIWTTICTDNLKKMTQLHRKFGRRKKLGGWMDSWQRGYLKATWARSELS